MSAPQPLASDASIATMVEQFASLLPEQAPLHTFVHHNTLHAFEHLPFDTAVVAAGKVFGTQPYQSEPAFAEHLHTGRILSSDIVEVVDADLNDQQDPPTSLLPTLSHRNFRINRLLNLFEVPRGNTLEWQLQETSLLTKTHALVDATRRRELHALADRHHADLPHMARLPALLKTLWNRIADTDPAESTASQAAVVRRRDQLLAVGLDDVDKLVHPLLIRLTAAFLDQGVASWRMPERDRGFLYAVRQLYGHRIASPQRWSNGLAAELRRQQLANLDAETTAQQALQRLGIDRSNWPEYIRATLLSLRGWAGMMRQFETRPDRAPVLPLPARLIDFLAVQLTLDAFAATAELRNNFGAQGSWDVLDALPQGSQQASREHAFEAFVMAQITGVDIDALSKPGACSDWLTAVRSFDSLERRRLLHRAYERRLRVKLLDGIAAHSDSPNQQAPTATVQAVFCIDDRECSTRRHLEEVMPDAETFGYAGFFGVAMAWQGLGEIQSRPLCPVNVTPEHYVTERALKPKEEATWREARRRRGLATKALAHGSRQVTGGGLLSTFLGWWSVIPMVGRCLFPRATAKVLTRIVDPERQQPITRLVLERTSSERDRSGRKVGYSIEEMTDVVESMLRTIALTQSFCDFVLIVGHGSSSENNPHEAAYDCGATGGGRGGPNARAFAAMANHPTVRKQLLERGITVPAATWFVGCYHNTCDDSMTWFDEDLMPEQCQPALEPIKQTLASACTLDAHERCRRFESAPHDDDPAKALRHAEGRSVDIAQPRPECGHATNAYAIVGRRSRTRGLFLDRRAFLVSYDPTTDLDGKLLERLLLAVVPVGAGINLEYYFSYVDPAGYGAGSKLPHNITGLIGVMDGHSSDLRTGLPWQMVEIHEPVRLLTVVEADVSMLTRLLKANPGIETFVRNEWIQLVAWSPTDARLWEYRNGSFQVYEPESRLLPTASSSSSFHRNDIDHLGCASIVSPRIRQTDVAVGEG
ncbi:MAG: hypothetical protein ACI85K_002329 [Hyphomicrobiaceae bacterium]|jgi:uncharacterized protein YbcC (UPF0753/DUF2309 family)